MELRRIVITGLGLITPIGSGKKNFWNGLVAGESGVDLVTRFDTSECKTKIAAEIRDFDPQDYGIAPKEAKRMDLFTQYGVAAASLAVEDSGLNLGEEHNDRIGTIIGTGIGGLMTLEEEKKKLVESQNRGLAPF